MHAILTIDDDGTEALCMLPDGNGGITPLLAADDEQSREIWRQCQRLAVESGRTMKLVTFSVRKDVGMVVP